MFYVYHIQTFDNTFVLSYICINIFKHKCFNLYLTGLEDMIAENRSNIKSESHSILENKFMTDDGSGVRYCILAFGKSPDGMLINCMYVLYKMDFVLGKAKEKKSMFGDLKRWITTKFELVKTSGLERCESFRNFFRIKALRGLQKEGLIDEINFVDS